jgi:hypothetical protein
MADVSFYFMTDQPTTCPICGARTDIIADFSHTLLKMEVNECLDKDCQYLFLEVDNEL